MCRSPWRSPCRQPRTHIRPPAARRRPCRRARAAGSRYRLHSARPAWTARKRRRWFRSHRCCPRPSRRSGTPPRARRTGRCLSPRWHTPIPRSRCNTPRRTVVSHPRRMCSRCGTRFSPLSKRCWICRFPQCRVPSSYQKRYSGNRSHRFRSACNPASARRPVRPWYPR